MELVGSEELGRVGRDEKTDDEGDHRHKRRGCTKKVDLVVLARPIPRMMRLQDTMTLMADIQNWLMRKEKRGAAPISKAKVSPIAMITHTVRGPNDQSYIEQKIDRKARSNQETKKNRVGVKEKKDKHYRKKKEEGRKSLGVGDESRTRHDDIHKGKGGRRKGMGRAREYIVGGTEKETERTGVEHCRKEELNLSEGRRGWIERKV
jgi:low affinity Fe/Cu permease